MKIDILITSFETGLRRGSNNFTDRKESNYIAIPATLDGIRGNLRFALKKFIAQGCTHYTIQNLQYKNSTKYCFTVYNGYKEV